MRKAIWVGWVPVFLAVTSVDSEGVGLKIGAGVMVSPSGGGGHASVEIPLSEEYSTYAAPFCRGLQQGRNARAHRCGAALQGPVRRVRRDDLFRRGGGRVDRPTACRRIRKPDSTARRRTRWAAPEAGSPSH